MHTYRLHGTCTCYIAACAHTVINPRSPLTAHHSLLTTTYHNSLRTPPTPLHVQMRPPAELWAEDTFHHNEDLSALNQVGTVREQYEWQPLSDASTWAIDAGVRSRIAPLEALVNHAAVLRSTKDNVLTFEYKGYV